MLDAILRQGTAFPNISDQLKVTGFETEFIEIFGQFWPVALLVFGFTMGPRIMKRIVK